MPVPTGTETAGILGSINALTKFLSPAVSVIGLSFLAYVLGILASPDSDRFLHPGDRIVGKLEQLGTDVAGSSLKFFLSPRMVHRLTKETGSSSPSLTQFSESALYGLVETEIAKHRSAKDFRPLLQKYGISGPGAFHSEERLAELMHMDVVEEALDPSAALLAADEKLYNNFDRARSEADFRFCITIPALAIAAASAWYVLETFWVLSAVILVFGVFVSMGLVFKGWFKLHEATDIAVAAIMKGTIKTRTLEQLESLEPVRNRNWWRRATGRAHH